MDPTVPYLAYLAFSLTLVYLVGSQLFRHGAVFLRDVFAGDPDLAQAVNRLLLVGFYLVNVGFVLLTTTVGVGASDPAGLLRSLTVKLGALAMILGGMHFVNLSALNNARRRRVLERRRPRSPQEA